MCDVPELGAWVANREGNWRIGQSVVENPSVVVCRVVDLEVQLEGLLVRSEPLPGYESNRGVRPYLDRHPRVSDAVSVSVRERRAVVVNEHLGDL